LVNSSKGGKSSLSTEKKAKIQILVIPGPIPETDKYGHKAMLKALNEWVRCSKCGAFLKKKDENTFECPRCGFEKPATPPPEY